MKRDPAYPLEPTERIADEIAGEAMEGLRELLPAELSSSLEEIIAVSLAHHPELRRATRRLAPDPLVASSGEVGADPAELDGQATGAGGRRR